jgi:hypothetical protein
VIALARKSLAVEPAATFGDMPAAVAAASSPTPIRRDAIGGYRRPVAAARIDSDLRARMLAIDVALEPLTWVVHKMAGGVLRSTRPQVDAAFRLGRRTTP